MRILVVDADFATRDFLSAALKSEGHQVIAVGDIHNAHVALSAWRPHLVVADLDLIDAMGWGFLRDHPRPDSSWPPVLMYSVEDPATLKRMEDAARRIGACCFLRKPFKLDELFGALALCESRTESGDDAVGLV